MSNKKITNVENKSTKSAKSDWKPSKENASKATRLRIIASIAFIGAIVTQMFAIRYVLTAEQIKVFLLVIMLIIDAAFAITGGLLWKKSNRLNPPSEKNKFSFFIQSQLGLIIAIIAFLPLIIVILKSDKLDGKQKGFVTVVAVLLMGTAGFLGTDFNPASIEKYQAQSEYVKSLTGQDLVYGTEFGSKYHLYADCPHVKGEKVKKLFEGKVADLHAINSKIGTGEDSLCEWCKAHALKFGVHDHEHDHDHE